MTQRIFRNMLTLYLVGVPVACVAYAQAGTEVSAPASTTTWEAARQLGSSKGKLYVITIEQPQRKQSCRVQSFTADKLVCARALGGSRTYLPQQVAALILPGDKNLKIGLVLGFNVALGAAIWGTVVLAAACPACAVATGIAALLFFGAAGAILIGDDQPDRLLYLAPGQELSEKVGYVQS